MLADVLAALTRIAGVRGVLIVSRDDGLVVADALMEGVDGPAVAALAASLAGRMRGVTRALGHPEPVLMHLVGSGGSLLAAPGRSGLLIVAVAAPDVNAGELRLGLLDAAERAA
ncbi:MAG TPA: roadblock/LC7 domain-containing protein [Gemmatimonadales bacterium]|nr:roadblock/LC7 domain-containing protein [Gemmatimonadales bacterium]